MITFDNNEAQNIVTHAVSAYEEHFKEDFPIFVYLKTENGLVTKECAENLASIIQKSIESNRLVDKPKNYDKRLY